MADETREPGEPYDAWLLRRVAEAVEADEVPGELLVELQAGFAVARAEPEAAIHVAAIRFIAELAEVPSIRAAEILAAIEAQPEVRRSVMVRRLAEAWLEGQRQQYRRQRPRLTPRPSAPGWRDPSP